MKSASIRGGEAVRIAARPEDAKGVIRGLAKIYGDKDSGGNNESISVGGWFFESLWVRGIA